MTILRVPMVRGNINDNEKKKKRKNKGEIRRK